jgi:hypothetical protein
LDAADFVFGVVVLFFVEGAVVVVSVALHQEDMEADVRVGWLLYIVIKMHKHLILLLNELYSGLQEVYQSFGDVFEGSELQLVFYIFLCALGLFGTVFGPYLI